jgi:hypothetical protein
VKFRFASFILTVYFLLGISVVVSSEFETTAALNLLSYICLYIIVPIYGAYGIWKQNLSSIVVSLLFFASHSVRVIGGASWFPYPPPFSLGIPLGSFSDGQGYLFDYFAAAMVIFLALLVRVLFTPNQQSSKE